jgi:hypothetical protein
MKRCIKGNKLKKLHKNIRLTIKSQFVKIYVYK